MPPGSPFSSLTPNLAFPASFFRDLKNRIV